MEIPVSPDEVVIALGAVFISFLVLGCVWDRIIGFRMKRTIRRTLGRKTTGKDLDSINTWMQVDEQAKKYNEARPYTATTADQAAPPSAMPDSWRPVRILVAIALIFLTLYLEHLISPKSAWDTDVGHRLAYGPLIFGAAILYLEWKTRKR